MGTYVYCSKCGRYFSKEKAIFSGNDILCVECGRKLSE